MQLTAVRMAIATAAMTLPASVSPAAAPGALDGRTGKDGREEISQFHEVAREDHGHRRHPARLNDPEEAPAVQKGDDGMVRLAQERVLSADVRAPPDEVRVHKAARQAHHPAQNPRDEDEFGRMHDLGDVVRDHEDAGPDHAAHDQHRDVEKAERPGQRRGIARFGDFGGNQLRVQGCLGTGAVLRFAGAAVSPATGQMR